MQENSCFVQILMTQTSNYIVARDVKNVFLLEM